MTDKIPFEIFGKETLEVPSYKFGFGHVYILYDENEKVAYVGQTTHIFRRLSDHYFNNKMNIQKCVYYILRSEDLLEAEKYFIDKEKPYLNNIKSKGYDHRRKDFDLVYSHTEDVKNEMSLKEYLYHYRISISDFAKKIGYERTSIQGYLCGYARLGKRAAFFIEKETKGLVSKERVLADNPEKKKKKQETISEVKP